MGDTSLEETIMGDTRGNHLLYVREGAAYSCGGSELYEEGEAFIAHLGHGKDWGEHALTPCPMLFTVTCPARVVQVAAGNLHSLVLCADGSLFSCGGGWEGPLGLGHTMSEERLTPVITLAPSSGQKVVSVAAGAAHSLAITDRGALYSWGWGRLAQLGHEGSRSEYLPRRLDALSSVHVRRVEAGPTHSVATTGDGLARAFGTTPHGVLLLLGASAATTSPTELPYEPLARYRALAGQLRVPRGSKSVEHLRVLRVGDPCRRRARQPTLPLASSRDKGTAAASGMGRSVSLTELSQMTRTFSVDSWLCSDETEELPELPTGLLHQRARWRHRDEDGFGLYDDGFECDSERSAARTYERASSQMEDDEASCRSFDAELAPSNKASNKASGEESVRAGRTGFEGGASLLM